ncbi:MAG: tetratricopeptide repeat protein, partial [Thermoflexales bacterium]|nr:tetratricopeptide repeat protein [Thermoflexales bacterium]
MRFGKLLLDRCGLYFSDRRRPELELGIRHAFAVSTCANIDEYFQLLQDPQTGLVEMDQLINAVTVSETHFFRDSAQFDALYYHVLPQIIERRRPLRTLRIWSAGCASGEEPYSIAMVLRELLPDVDEWSITILGTDINTQAIERARRAIYGGWAFREARAKQWRPRYFTPWRGSDPVYTSATSARYELSPEIRRMVTFDRLNLAESTYPSYQSNTMLMDLVLCRNVTIYFNQVITQQVVDRFYQALVDGGWLVVGHSEPSLETYRHFQVCNLPDTILYRRIYQPEAKLSAWPATPAFPSTVPAPTSGVAQVVSPPSAVPGVEIVPLSSPPAAASFIPPALPLMDEGDPLGHAQELIEYGRSEEARELLVKFAQSRPGYALAYVLLGQACANLGRWQEAEEWCRKATDLDKLTLDAYYTLSLVLQHQGKLGQAIDSMKKVVYIDRTYVLGHFGLANLYHENSQ